MDDQGPLFRAALFLLLRQDWVAKIDISISPNTGISKRSKQSFIRKTGGGFMKRILVAAIALVAMSATAPAFAQGWWNGPEIGVQGGYAWGTSSGAVGSPPSLPYSFHPGGGIAGIHAGYNWQWDHVVLGVEGDAEWADLHTTHLIPGVFSIKSHLYDDASVRGKLGWAFDRILVYGTGGVAFGGVGTTYLNIINAPFMSSNGIRTGWTAGAGLAYAITPNWELGAEYRYTDLGHKGSIFTGGLLGRPVTDRNEFNFSAVRAVLSYRFAPPPPPPPMAAPMPAAAPAPAPAMARTFLVFFDFDKYNLTPDARRVIEAAAQSYKATGSARIDVSGYTDLAGTQAYNLRLSQRRADAVAAYLEKQGVPKNALDVKWFGKEHPRV